MLLACPRSSAAWSVARPDAVETSWTTRQELTTTSSACLAALKGLAESKIADRLLHHPDQVFRLSWILGEYSNEQSNEHEWNYEGDTGQTDLDYGESEEFLVSPEDSDNMQEVLRAFVSRIRQLAIVGRERTEADLGVSFDSLPSSDVDFAEEYFTGVVESLPEFDGLIDDVLDEVLNRLRYLPSQNLTTKKGGWPETWVCEFDSNDRDEFIRQMRWFSSNYSRAFGKLITPLVQGIRMQGPFVPEFTTERVELVLLDGQGLGHTPDSTANVSTHVTKRYAEVDAIVLVDNAQQPMLPATLAIARSILASGYQRKLVIAFTHVDEVSGPNLREFPAKKAHVLRSVLGGIASLREALGSALVDAFATDLDERCFMLGWLNKPLSAKSKGPTREMEALLSFCRDSVLPAPPSEAAPVYDAARLLFAAQSADKQFQELWRARLGFIVLSGVDRKHWATIKALNRRVALSMNVRANVNPQFFKHTPVY